MPAKTGKPLQNRRRSRLPWLVVVILISLLAAVEIYCRLTLPPPSYAEASPRAIRLKEHRPLQHAEIPVPEGLGLQHKRVVLRTDKDGFIEPSALHLQPDLTIVFLGGSTTECLYLPEEKRLPYLAGRLLEARLAKTVNSYNAGVSGNHSLHSLNILVNKILPLKPDAVVLTHNQNDLVFLMYMGSYWSDHPTRSLVVTRRDKTGLERTLSAGADLCRETVRWLIPGISRRLGALYLRLSPPGRADEWSGFRKTGEGLDLERIAKEFASGLESFIHVCRTRGIKPVLATQAGRLREYPDPLVKRALAPLEKAGISYAEFRKAHRHFNQVIRETAAENEAALIDLEAGIPPTAEYFYDPVHLTERGAGTAAELSARILAEIVTSATAAP